MSYQVLARKWRPAKFEQVVGQSHVLHALTNALTQNRLHHAYLFSGTRGVGKTSLARLFAKGLNCEQGVTATPCGVCSSCVEIAQGRFVDLIEVDAASRTKVDDTRELLDNVQYRPSRGRYKVYLIDEVHMLSRSSFNALLKTLEEPPEHVKFLLATTDPQRLPVTVLSRCLQFNLKSLTLDEICLKLAKVLGQESISFDDGAIKLLAKAANGSMRDALSLTDQAIAFGAGQVQLNQVQTMLGTIDEHYVIVLLKALCDGDIGNLLQVTDEVLSFGADPIEVLRSLLELLHQITLTQFAPAAAQLSKYAEQIQAFASQLTPEQVQLYYQLLLTGRKDLPHAPDPKSGLEMALLRAVAFVPETPVKKWQSTPLAEKLVLPTASVTDDASNKISNPSHVDPSSKSQLQAKPSTPASAPESDDCEDEVLLSEQALILSQAQSQLQASSTQKTAESDQKPEPRSEQQSDTQQRAAEDMTSSEVDLQAYADFEQQADSDPDSYSDLFAEAQASEAQPPEIVAEQVSQNVAKSHNDITDETKSEESADDSTNAAETLVDSNKQVVTAASPALEDDLLDAVLAARQSLLTDLDDTSSKESDTKKPEVGPKAYVPPKRKQPVNNPNEESETQTTVEQLNSDAEDRPPWEAPAESSPQLQTQQVDNGDIESVLVAADESVATLEAEISTESALLPQAERETNLAAGAETAVSAQAVQTPTPYSDEIKGNSIDLKWYRLMSALDIGGRVRQLAVNSVCQQFVDPLPLVLKPNQKHLEAPGAVSQLEAALSKALGADCQVSFAVGVEAGRETPLEIRKRFHRELLQKSQHDLLNDDNIRWLTEVMNAEIDLDSLSYPNELLGQRAQTIELIDKSNFIELVQS
ncbi:DNA polymerase III subunit gamma/tau [Shewanella sp. Isolate11]|uniref:DNA polymerase III subunit gamma/tau n=1 Tax=Shewanella sp. Isolate11 TaxID=2908530 RepID=UPI001EFE2878|nr:DNA polymerase III subunit gamma/tau [Shewanella sp. Isolate11]MCG9696873.1 DNA polymerase III subunit gamma/tau [Shewanella sp. Isolate11]